MLCSEGLHLLWGWRARTQMAGHVWRARVAMARPEWKCLRVLRLCDFHLGFLKVFCVYNSPIILCSLGSVPLSLNEELVKPVISVPS